MKKFYISIMFFVGFLYIAPIFQEHLNSQIYQPKRLEPITKKWVRIGIESTPRGVVVDCYRKTSLTKFENVIMLIPPQFPGRVFFNPNLCDDLRRWQWSNGYVSLDFQPR